MIPLLGGLLYDRLRMRDDQPIPVAEYELILSRLKDGRTAMTFRADKTYSSTAYNERMEMEDGQKIMYDRCSQCIATSGIPSSSRKRNPL